MEEKRRYKFAALPRRAVQPASSPRTVTDHQLKHVYNVFSVINKAWVSDEERGGEAGRVGAGMGERDISGQSRYLHTVSAPVYHREPSRFYVSSRRCSRFDAWLLARTPAAMGGESLGGARC